MVVLGKLGMHDLAGQVDGQFRAALGQRLQGRVGRRVDVAQGPGLLGLGSRFGFGQDFLLGMFRVAAGLVQQRAHFVGRVGQLFLVLGEQKSGLLVVSLGLGDVLGDILLALFERLHDRTPGKPLQHHQQNDENHQSPNCQVGIDRQRIRRSRLVTGIGVGSFFQLLLSMGERAIGVAGPRRHDGKRADHAHNRQTEDPTRRVHDFLAGATKATVLGGVEEHTHDQSEKRGTFDQRRRDDHGRLHVAGNFGLAGHAFHGAGADLANAEPGPQDHQSGTQRGAKIRPMISGARGRRALSHGRRSDQHHCKAQHGDFDKAIH